MNTTKHPGCTLDPLERVRFFPRQLVTPEDLNDQLTYFVDKLRRHNRFVVGFGVACGLGVRTACEEPPCEPALAYRVLVDQGYALTPGGDDVYVPRTVELDLADHVRGLSSDCQPDPDKLASKLIYLALRPTTCPTRPVRVSSAACGCGDAPCEFSRLREGFEWTVLACEPAIYAQRRAYWTEHVKTGAAPPCWDCGDDTWVVIAELELITGGLVVRDRRRYTLPSVLAAGMMTSLT